MNIAAIWMGLPQWARDAIKILGIVLAVALIGRQYVKGKENEAVSRDRAKTAAKQAQVKVAVNERSTEIINEERHNADSALQARDRSPDFPSSDLVPDPVARVIFRD